MTLRSLVVMVTKLRFFRIPHFKQLKTIYLNWKLRNHRFHRSLILCGRITLILLIVSLLYTIWIEDDGETNKTDELIFEDTFSLSIVPEFELELSRMDAIPQILHISWWDKDVMETQRENAIIRNGLANFKQMNPEWNIQISNDLEVDQYLHSKLDEEDYEAIADRHIVEKADLWRLLKVYYEGGVYMDLDRMCNVPMDRVLQRDVTTLILSIWSTHIVSFTQDFMGSAKGNSLFKRAIDDNIESRRQCHDIYQNGPLTYRMSVFRTLFGEEMANRISTISAVNGDRNIVDRVTQKIHGLLSNNQFIISGVERFGRSDSVIFKRTNWSHSLKSMDVDREFAEAKNALHRDIGRWFDGNHSFNVWRIWIRCQLSRLSPI